MALGERLNQDRLRRTCWGVTASLSVGNDSSNGGSIVEIEYIPLEELQRLEKVLLLNMRQHAPELRRVLDNANSSYEDGIYRYYHLSLKVFWLQEQTNALVNALTAIAPEGRPFCRFFDGILQQGTGREFSLADNQHWLERAAPIVQAFFHARYFLEMAVKYAAELQEPPQPMPSGWAALLCLYRLR